MEPRAAAPTETDLPLNALQLRVMRTLYGVMAVLGVTGTLTALLLDRWVQGPAQRLMVVGYAAMALASLLALRLAPAQALRVLAPVQMGSLLLVGGIALVTGWGLQVPALALFGIALCISHVLSPPRQAWATTALAAVIVLGLVVVERLGLVGAAAGLPPLGARAVLNLAGIAVGALTGRGIAQLLRGQLAAAAEREQRFRALLGIAANAYWETDAELRISQAWWRAGDDFRQMPEMVGHIPWGFAELRFTPEVSRQLRQAMAERQVLRDMPFEWLRPGGQVRHYLFNGEPRFDRAGRFLGYWGVTRDVTAERRTLDALAASESRYRQLFQALPSPAVLHVSGLIVEANPAAARLLGYDSPEQLLGLNVIDDCIVPELHQIVRQRVATVERMDGGVVMPEIELTMVTRQGTPVYVRTVSTRADHHGQPATLALSIDETGRRAATRALDRSQALLAQVVATTPDAITVTDLATSRYVMVNEAFTRIAGYSAEETVGHTAAELGIWNSVDDRNALLQAIRTYGSVVDRQVDFVAKSGQKLTLMVSGTQLEIEGRPHLLLCSRDISESRRVRLEREAILANASVGIAFTRDRRFELANPQFEAIFGWPAGSLVGQPGRAVWASDEDYEALGREIGPALGRGEAVDIDRQALRRDGSLFQLRLRAKAIDPRRPAESGTIWIAEDVTAARQAEQELARARDAAEAANRAKSDFLANTSHEIRTPLNALQGLAGLARQPGLPPERLRQYLDQIGESADLLGLIISDILDLAKIEAGKLLLEDRPFALDALLASLCQSHAALAAARGLRFDAEIDPALPAWVRGDALRLRQILANFLHNALKFTERGSIRLVARALPGGRARFEVHDTGPGIDGTTRARLFRPFTQADESTTRRHGGTGLGLSICHELAVLLGGQVGLDSHLGRGSCFHVELPLPALPAPLPAPTEAGDDDARLRGARVLLVEDNSVNMMIGTALLEQWGVQVLQAGDGAQALALVAAETGAGRQLDAVLMDVQMPGISGYETTEALRRQYPAEQLPVVALTAAALVSERERALAAGMNDFLTKPIEPRRLRDALLRALRTRSAKVPVV